MTKRHKKVKRKNNNNNKKGVVLYYDAWTIYVLGDWTHCYV